MFRVQKVRLIQMNDHAGAEQFVVIGTLGELGDQLVGVLRSTRCTSTPRNTAVRTAWRNGSSGTK